jgi:hypothetical protein
MRFQFILGVFFAVMAIVISAANAKADVLYSNGTSASDQLGYYIDGNLISGQSEAVAFLVTAPISLTDMQLVLFTPYNTATPSTISWDVGNQPFTGGVASGTASGATLNVSFLRNVDGDTGWHLYNATISFSPNVSVPSSPDPYYLTLFDATAGTGWQASTDGHQDSVEGNVNNYYTNGYPPYYVIEGNVTPEPSTFVALCSALPLLVGAFYLRRRRANA